MQRALDILGALGIALIFSPALLLLPWWIKRDGGPAVYKQVRIGYEGRPFEIYKFRSMAVNADERLARLLENDPKAANEWAQTFKLKNDPRITTVGRFLRKTSLDELPQLLNVLNGEMSLVGPRPIVYEEARRYGRWFGHYLAAKPGLTGLWQVTGRNDISYRRRVAIDRRYTSLRSVGTNLLIILATPFAMLRCNGH